MSIRQIKAVVTDENKKPIAEDTVNANIPDTLEDFSASLGGDIVANLLRQKYVINLQAYMRGLIKKGKDHAAVQAAVDAWKPGLVKEKRPPTEKALDLYSQMSPEQQADFFKKLKERVAGAKPKV